MSYLWDNAEYLQLVFSAYTSRSDLHNEKDLSSAPTNDLADLSHHPQNKADFDMAVVSPVTLAFSHLHILKGKFQINVRNWRCTKGPSIEGD